MYQGYDKEARGCMLLTTTNIYIYLLFCIFYFKIANLYDRLNPSNYLKKSKFFDKFDSRYLKEFKKLY